MAAIQTGRASPLAAALALWRNVRVQRIVFQAAFAVFVVWAGYLLITNLTGELDTIGLEPFPFVDLSSAFPFVDFNLDFLGQRAGFGIKESSFGRDYSANDSYGVAYFVGVLNTLRVALIGIALATAVGLVAGVMRLSPNWLISRIANVYVEVFRNVPLLVQLIFWFTAVILKLPAITEGTNVLGFVFISNRALAVPGADATGRFGLWLIVLVVAAALAAAVWVYRARREERTGRPSYPWWWASLGFAAIALAAYFALGQPLDFDRPERMERSYVGGMQLSPEFAALLIGLVLYTGAFIAEVVRGSIQAIQKGQTEAAMALGFTGLQRLRFVILPQAMRIMIPPLTNQYLNLTKNSSLAVFVAYPDLFQVSRVTINQTGQAVPIIVLVMLTYLTMSLVTSAVMNLLNSRVQITSR